MFNAERKLHKYGSVEEVIDDFYQVRMRAYADRKAHLVREMDAKLVKLSNRAAYILANLDGSIDLRRKTAQQVAELLTTRGFARVDGEYTYLTKMPMDSVTQENVDAILKEKGATERELADLKNTTIEQMWVRELDAFETEYRAYRANREKIQSADPKPKDKSTKPKIIRSKPVPK